MKIITLGNKTRAVETKWGTVARMSGRSGKYRFSSYSCDTPARLRDALAKNHYDAEICGDVFKAATMLAVSASAARDQHTAGINRDE